jgi:hypothetical protein
MWSLLLVVMLVWGLASAATAETHGLFVGVNHCPSFRLPDGSIPRPLQGAEDDATRMSKRWQERGESPSKRIRLLVGADATLEGVRKEVKHVAAQINVADEFVFYFSGHGTQLKDEAPYDEEDGLDEALCLHGGQANGSGLLIDDEVASLLEGLPCRRVLVILDCCHAGTGTKDGDEELHPKSLISNSANKPLPEQSWGELSRAKDLQKTMTAIFACRAEQQAYERRFAVEGTGKPRRAGQLSHYLLQTLEQAGDADEQEITIERALRFVNDRLAEFNRGRPPELCQHPWAEGNARQALFPPRGDRQ